MNVAQYPLNKQLTKIVHSGLVRTFGYSCLVWASEIINIAQRHGAPDSECDSFISTFVVVEYPLKQIADPVSRTASIISGLLH